MTGVEILEELEMTMKLPELITLDLVDRLCTEQEAVIETERGGIVGRSGSSVRCPVAYLLSTAYELPVSVTPSNSLVMTTTGEHDGLVPHDLGLRCLIELVDDNGRGCTISVTEFRKFIAVSRERLDKLQQSVYSNGSE